MRVDRVLGSGKSRVNKFVVAILAAIIDIFTAIDTLPRSYRLPARCATEHWRGRTLLLRFFGNCRAVAIYERIALGIKHVKALPTEQLENTLKHIDQGLVPSRTMRDFNEGFIDINLNVTVAGPHQLVQLPGALLEQVRNFG